MTDAADRRHLQRCTELVDGTGQVRAGDRNRIAAGDATQHPEFALARWAGTNLSPAERAAATVYTSGEHCPMCAAAHAWVGLGRIVYASSAAQLIEWLDAMGVPRPPVRPLPIQQIAPRVTVVGSVGGLDRQVRALHRRRHGHDPEA